MYREDRQAGRQAGKRIPRDMWLRRDRVKRQRDKCRHLKVKRKNRGKIYDNYIIVTQTSL